MKYKDKLLIIGAGGHGKVVADVAIKMNCWKSIQFLDDNHSLKQALGLDVIGNTSEYLNFIDEYDLFIGIGNNAIRNKLHKILERNKASIPVLIHPSSIIANEVNIERGTVIMAGTVINSSTKIGKGCIINTGSTIDHDNNIEDFVHISPGVHVAGNVNIGKSSWLGIGSIIKNNVNITHNCIVGAGGVVIDDLFSSGKYVGVPVRRI